MFHLFEENSAIDKTVFWRKKKSEIWQQIVRIWDEKFVSFADY